MSLIRLRHVGFSFKTAVTCKIMAIRIVQVDAFTNRAFAGNPAAVCVLKEAPDEQWMRDVAREMNLSETAFLVPKDDGYQLRWLTPAVEVDLCGHATVASAHVLWQDGHLEPGQQARILHAERTSDGGPAGRMDRAGFSGEACCCGGGSGGIAAGAGSGGGEVRGEERLRLPGGGGFGRDAARAFAGPFDAAEAAGAGDHRDGA